MPLCPQCGKPLNCFAHGNVEKPSAVTSFFEDIASTMAPCLLKKGAIWIHVVDDTGSDVQGVSTKVATAKPTKETGISMFDELSAGPYNATLEALTGQNAQRYLPPGQMVDPVTVKSGQITYVTFVLTRKNWKLNVTVNTATAGVWPTPTVRLLLPNPLDDASGEFQAEPWKYTLERNDKVVGDVKVVCDGWDLVEAPVKIDLKPGDVVDVAFTLKQKPWIKFVVKKKTTGDQTKVLTKVKVKPKLPGWAGTDFTTDLTETHIPMLAAGTGEIEEMSAGESWEFDSIVTS